ncbi:MAG: N-acetyl-gamma-glutamyl-phosphate reductase [Planctomycetota bacterium]|nr:MAG: N-acetyl-gamma-glutamyl-phosphate reductase [Planctomycetota bacterium]
MKPAVAIVGASGYAGRELARLVDAHPGLADPVLMSARPGVLPDPPSGDYEPAIGALDPAAFERLDGVFLCTPHGAAAALARAALDAGCKVVDLSADFRLKEPEVYEATYGAPHPAPDLLDVAVYGLTERARADVRGARLVANPGCYPTSILLALGPLLDARLLEGGAPIIADSKSGVSGAGKTPRPGTIFGTVHDNFLAYGVGTHRHTPEIHAHAGTDRIVFVPHLLPIFRGLLSTMYLSTVPGVTADDVRAALAEAYAGEPFVRVFERGLPELARVQHTNLCDLGVADAYGQVVVISAIDNLVKGAAGQALQNMNLMLGLEETLGLPCGSS